jgi:hypothetical protein
MMQGIKSSMMFGLAALAVAVMTGSLSANHSWGNYHWARQANPFTLQVGDNVTPAWDDYLNYAISDWSTSTVLNLTNVPGAASNKQCRPPDGRIEVCNGTYGFNGWLGIARIYVTGSHIHAASTRLNDSYFNTSTYNTPAWRRFVMCQEVGHDFGLAHQDEEFGPPNLGSCMDYTNDPDGGGAYGDSNVRPDDHDYAQLVTIYSHTDSFTTIGAGAPTSGRAASQSDDDHPSQWGRLVSSTRNGRGQVYELDLGNGRKVLTHVFWADPEADAQRGR